MNIAKMRRNYQVIVLRLVFFLSVAATSSAQTNKRSVNISPQLERNTREQYSPRIRHVRRAAGRTLRSAGDPFGIRFTVGSCKLEEFFRTLKKCSRDFHASHCTEKSTQNNCSASYVTLTTCMSNAYSRCLDHSNFARQLSSADISQIKNNFMVFVGNEEFWCEKGGLGVSSDYLPLGAKCHPVFYHVAEGCTSSYRELFNKNACGNKLCREYEEAKKCYLETMLHHCSFSSMFQQIVKIAIEVAEESESVCKQAGSREKLTYQKLLRASGLQDCPPYSLADVAFALDGTSGASTTQYTAMKNMINAVVKTLYYGSRGIQVSVSHFDTSLRTNFKFGEVESKDELQSEVSKMTRPTAKGKNKSKRMMGKSLSALSRKMFYSNKGGDELIKTTYNSGQRPHNAAVLFVMTSGPSTDSMITGLKLLKKRNVHVVFVGPSSFKVPTTAGGSPYIVIGTNFKLGEVERIAMELTRGICTFDIIEQQLDNGMLTEERNSNSEWQKLRDLLSLFGQYDVSLSFELKPIVETTTPMPTTPSPVRIRSGGPFDPIENIVEGTGREIRFGTPTEVHEERRGLSFRN